MNPLREELKRIVLQILHDEELGREMFENWTMDGGELDQGLQEDWHWISHFFADANDRVKDKELDAYFRSELQRILEK